jgi:FtsP/CotA-like multicopper oxidase with cupredoxin domain
MLTKGPLKHMSHQTNDHNSIPRRSFLKLGAASVTALTLGSAGALIVPDLSRRGLLSADGVLDAASIAIASALYTEVFPTSPLILKPFSDPLVIPKAMRAVTQSDLATDTWCKANITDGNATPLVHQSSVDLPAKVGTYQAHQIPAGSMPTTPLFYRIRVQVNTHSFTSSQVLPINALGQPAISFDNNGKTTIAAGTARTLPPSTIYGFNGTFPGPRINAEYGKPVLVRFENHLDENPLNLDTQDFGAPDRSFLTHLHNGHTAPESDGNPNYAMKTFGLHGYKTKQWVDNLYLNWPAGGDDREKQSFFWFHDHRMDHTGANVYKGMVGLFPIYDPKDYSSSGGPKGMYDGGDETQGLRLPGVRTNNPDGTFDVDYDIPLAFYDTRLDDGVTMHQDIHDTLGEYQAPFYPNAKNPNAHPEWWGKTFFKHFPNHGFVGDIFTVNGTAYPVLEVERRKYRFRFLDASISRIYEFKLMSSTQGPKASKDLGYTGNELQGQYRIPDGQQCMKFTQIADDGGLLPFPIVRDSFELWPAKRREFIVDFTQYQDGTPTSKGDAIYLTDVMKMPDGRMWTNSSRFSPDPAYKVPVLKFVIKSGNMATDNSVMPTSTTKLRDLPPLPSDWKNLLNNRLIFEVQRGSAGGEIEWLINGIPFDPTKVSMSLKNPAGNTLPAQQKKNSFNLWEIRNGGGGWVHPFHLHMEEHRTVMRNGKDVSLKADPGHPDDMSREDLAALDPSESVIVYRGFRDFVGPYVAHCHNLAHEDHAMMFGWEITP